MLILLVDQGGVALVNSVVTAAHRLLQGVDYLGAEQVGFAVAPPLVVPPHIQTGALLGAIGEGVVVPFEGFLGNHLQANTLETRGRPGEVSVHHRLV